MAVLFSDENVPYELVEALCNLGHDVLTAVKAGRANQGIPDPDVLAYASMLGRAVLTNDRRHFHHLHRQAPHHAGIVTYTDDPDRQALVTRIHDALLQTSTLNGVLIKVIRPP